MSTISGVSSAWSMANSQRTMGAGRMAERMLAKFDADGSGGVNTTELQGLLDDAAQKTGASSTGAADLLAQGDSNGDGSLDSSELSAALQSVLPPPPSTMAFAQSREATGTGGTGQTGDDLFGKVDADASGSVSAEELQALLEKMSGGTASQTGVSSDELFSQLDTDGDGGLTQAEFDAGRPSGTPGGGRDGGGGIGGVGGMPPPPPGGAQAASTNSSTTYDPLDTNEDGVVSAAELAASATQQDAITALFQAIDADGDSQISSSESQSFIDQLTQQVTASQSDTGSTSQTLDLRQLAQFARRQYEAAASGWSGKASNSTLSVVA